jgi:hypothetical protein
MKIKMASLLIINMIVGCAATVYTVAPIKLLTS